MLDLYAERGSTPSWIDRIVDRMKSLEKPLLGLGIAFQVVVLVGMIATRAVPLVTGDAVLLRVVPVDPRDMFRGDYVVLGYEAGQIPREGIPGLPAHTAGTESQGRTVYVSLTPEADGVHWKADKYSLTQPSGGKYLCGKIAGWNRIEFGIESYYVQEGKGRMYEDAMRSRRLSAEVSVAPNGQAALRGLKIE